MNLRFEPATQSRFDYFLIWNHGLSYRDDILSELRAHPDLDIVRVQYYTPPSISALINSVYSFDYAPIEHLRKKTAYLEELQDSEVLVIFIRNNNPQEFEYGHQKFNHIESATLKSLKEKLRDKFNPKTETGQRTEKHIIHASDNQEQTDHIAKMVGLSGVDFFQRNCNIPVDLPYHLNFSDHDDIVVKNIEIEALTASIHTGERDSNETRKVKLEETPHFHYLSGEKEFYLDYWQKYFGYKLLDDHYPEKLDVYNEKDDFQIYNPIVVRDEDYTILDGLHRAVIYKYKKRNKIPAILK